MLTQYIIKSDSADDIRRQLRAALDAGCSWVEIRAAESVSDADITAILTENREELARRNCVSILADRYELAKKIETDGVHLYDLQKTPFSQVRVHVEAWPIIGVSVATVADAIALQGRDLDYLFFAGDDLNRLTEIAAWLNENAIEWPLVAYPCKLDTGMQAIEAGATALAIDSAVSEDPAILSTRIQEFIDKFK